jgi:hypothetical protein
MLIATVLGALIVVVIVLERRSHSSRIQVRSCCSAALWPPDDLTGHDVGTGPADASRGERTGGNGRA